MAMQVPLSLVTRLHVGESTPHENGPSTVE
jgi:hypothetical protein